MADPVVSEKTHKVALPLVPSIGEIVVHYRVSDGDMLIDSAAIVVGDNDAIIDITASVKASAKIGDALFDAICEKIAPSAEVAFEEADDDEDDEFDDDDEFEEFVDDDDDDEDDDDLLEDDDEGLPAAG